MSLLENRKIYITYGKLCKTIAKGNTCDLVAANEPDLTCDHEEVDTRLLLHAKHASLECHAPILLRSPDTDRNILVLATALSSRDYLPPLFRTQKNKVWTYIDVLSMTNRLCESVCDGLPGMHALSGCDSTSKFCWTCKKLHGS